MKLSSCILLLAGHLGLTLAGSSFGGVNHYYLPNLPATQRDQVITKLYQGGTKVIRTIIEKRPYNKEKGNTIETSTDVETSLGVFDFNALKRYDDMLASVHRISGGTMKVILSLHNANALAKGESDDFCDVYCHYIYDNNIEWHGFYKNNEMRKRLKERFLQVLTKYKSPNFGKTWNQLSEVILAIDLQNEPMVGDGNREHDMGDWVCDISTYLKESCGLDGIAVSTGGIRGANYIQSSATAPGQNWPDEVFTCNAVDIISFHGYYADNGNSWLKLFSEDESVSVLRSKALKNNKLLLVEEWSYMGGKSDNFATQKSEIKAQGEALNLRGIPWLYWDIMSGADGWCDSDGCKEVSVDGTGPWPVLSAVMQKAPFSASDFDWSKYFPGDSGAGSCTWGCLGWDCSEKSPCSEGRQCTNGICKAGTGSGGGSSDPSCTWGCLGWNCSDKSPCDGGRRCIEGICHAPLASRANTDSTGCTWGCEGWDCGADTPCADGRECVKGICHTTKASFSPVQPNESGSCTWGCEGWNCDSKTPCADGRECMKGICHSKSTLIGDQVSATQTGSATSTASKASSTSCTWGCEGWDCNDKTPCAGGLQCMKGICHIGSTSTTASASRLSSASASASTTGCTWGCEGWDCDSKTPCAKGRQCIKGVCKSGVTFTPSVSSTTPASSSTLVDSTNTPRTTSPTTYTTGGNSTATTATTATDVGSGGSRLSLGALGLGLLGLAFLH